MKSYNQSCTLVSPIRPSSNNLEDLFSQVLLSGLITQNDRKKIQLALLHNISAEENLTIINRLIYGVRRGFVKVVA